MIRFFVRLAIAALADWLTWQISTPEMRTHRSIQRHYRKITRAMKAATPAAREFGEVMRETSEAFLRFHAEDVELRQRVGEFERESQGT